MRAYTEEVDVLVKDWFRRCRESQVAHFEYGSILQGRHIVFGVPAIALSTIVGTAVFGSWTTSTGDQWLRTLLGILSMTAAAAMALQTFLNLSDRAAKHKAAGAAYGAIRRELELLKQLPPDSDREIRQILKAVKQKMDDLAASAPSIPSKHKQMIDMRLKSQPHDRIFKLNVATLPTTGED